MRIGIGALAWTKPDVVNRVSATAMVGVPAAAVAFATWAATRVS
jgi:hypothetical protein